jgi:hypothetical protein
VFTFFGFITVECWSGREGRNSMPKKKYFMVNVHKNPRKIEFFKKT